MAFPIVLPDPCLDEKLDPEDFAVARMVIGAEGEAIPPPPFKPAAAERRRSGPAGAD